MSLRTARIKPNRTLVLKGWHKTNSKEWYVRHKGQKMKDQYHINLEKYSLQKFKNNLRSRDMIPSRVILKDDLDERFQILENNGITNHKELIDTLKTKSKIEQFSKETGLSIEYLTILNREAKSYLPNPIRLDKFPGVPKKYVEKLEAMGIKNTRHLFNAARDKNDRVLLSQTTELPIEILNELIINPRGGIHWPAWSPPPVIADGIESAGGFKGRGDRLTPVVGLHF